MLAIYELFGEDAHFSELLEQFNNVEIVIEAVLGFAVEALEFLPFVPVAWLECAH